MPSAPPPRNNAGFTLVEMAIVLVIIGLIIGGVMVGKTMITNIEISRVYKDSVRYSTAVNTFRLKYNCLPGDCANATNFFGDKVDCPSSATDGTPGTCSGDGDEKVETSPDERARVWEQLSSANLIEGGYSYSAAAGLNEGQAMGVYIPRSIRDAGVYLTYTTVFQEPQNYFVFGGYDSASTGLSDGFMTSQEGLAFDLKFDDGQPSYGKIKAGRSQSGTGPAATRCVSSSITNPPANVTYVTTSTDTCKFFIKP